MKKIPQN